MYSFEQSNRRNNYIKRRRFNRLMWVLTFFIIFVVIVGIEILPFTRTTVYNVTVTDKQVKRDNNKDTYLIYTKNQDGNPVVLKNEDSLIIGKFNSSDFYAKLEIGKTYRIKVYGFRVPILSMYENITSITEANILYNK